MIIEKKIDWEIFTVVLVVIGLVWFIVYLGCALLS